MDGGELMMSLETITQLLPDYRKIKTLKGLQRKLNRDPNAVVRCSISERLLEATLYTFEPNRTIQTQLYIDIPQNIYSVNSIIRN